MTSPTPLDLVAILASVRDQRFGPVVARWFVDQVERYHNLDVEVLDLAEHPLPPALPGSLEDLVSTGERPAPRVELARRLEAADAFVVITPEYNHSFPASIKHLIDWHLTPWQAKPVGFVSYGGVAGGARAVEHLRQVFAEMHAVTVRDAVTFTNFWERFDAEGRSTNPEESEAAAKLLIDQLVWWGSALRTARSQLPYGTSA